MKKRLITFLTVLFVTIGSRFSAEILDGPQGPVEFVGLENWTASELFEAIKELDPDKPFHACAAVMVEELDFADAAAFGYFGTKKNGSSELYTLIIGVENRAHVHYRSAGNKTFHLPDTWLKLHTSTEENYQKVAAATFAYFYVSFPDPEVKRALSELTAEEALAAQYEVVEMLGSTRDVFDLVSAFFQDKVEHSDYEFAQKVIREADSWSARFVATIVLAQFPKLDTAWHTLAESLIDPSPQVRDIAAKLLDGLVIAKQADTVNWSRARSTLLALLGGTNAFAFNEILDVLIATKVDRTLATDLIRERPRLLIDAAGAQHEKFRKPAHTFLTIVSGEDFGRNGDGWRSWIESQDLTN